VASGLTVLDSGAFSAAGGALFLSILTLPAYGALRVYLKLTRRVEWLAAELTVARERLESQREVLAAQARALDERSDALAEQRLAFEAQAVALGAARDAARGAARDADRVKSEFLAVMSHEIRAPLSAIIGFARFLTSPDVRVAPEQARRYLDRIVLNAHRLLALVSDILDYSRLEAGPGPLEVAPVNLSAVVRDVASTLESSARAKGIALRLELPERRAVLETDTMRVTQVLVHLVGNAIKFTEHGSVTVAVSVEDGAPAESAAGPAARPVCVVEVRDTGIGIPMEQLETVFEPFRQGDMGQSRRHGGAGLGLAIARALCTLLGATLSLDSVQGVGTTVRVRFAASLPASGVLAAAETANARRRVA
jgi:signal transduction histidine kinase